MALAHLSIAVLLQIENRALYGAWGKTGPGEIFHFLLWLPLLQLENLVVAALLAALAFAFPVNRLGKSLALGTTLVANLYVILDQLAYKLFLDHFRPSWIEGPYLMPASFVDSVVAETSLPLWINLVLCLGTGVWLRRALDAQPSLGQRKVKWRLAAGTALVLATVGAVGREQWRCANLEHHPLLTLASDALMPRRRPAQDLAIPSASLEDLRTPAFGVDRHSQAEAWTLREARAALRDRKGPPNIILIILESVGSENLLEDGLPSVRVTPFLHSLAQHAVVFDSIYTSFPSTVRSHLDLNMGGRIITYGSVYDELSCASRAPNLVQRLHDTGLATACFSAAGDSALENMDGFYSTLGYDTLVDFAHTPPAFQKEHSINANGAQEEAIARLAIDWVDRRRDPGRPFLLTFLTNSTHHPYGLPPGAAGQGEGKGDLPPRRERYLAALRYCDGVLERLILDLGARGKLENALIVVTGDHGESFQERHAGNLLHKTRIYDENVKTFLIIADPRRLQTPVRARRVGAMGDVMPTVLALAGGSSAGVPGQDLMDPAYRMRTVFFHKSVVPEQWGLRDGDWKFIECEIGAPEPELYDLRTDPDEQRNLAGLHPEMVAVYHARCLGWYLAANKDFVEHLIGFTLAAGRPLLDAKDVITCGPKILRFGRRLADGRFQDDRRFDPGERIVAFTQWTSYRSDRHVIYEWTSPAGRQRSFWFNVRADWSRTYVDMGATLPMDEGAWTLTLRYGRRRLISAGFVVARGPRATAAVSPPTSSPDAGPASRPTPSPRPR